jgi:hypothetical protein
MVPFPRNALDDDRLTWPLIFINEAFNSQFININSIDLIRAAEQLLGGIRPEKPLFLPLFSLQIRTVLPLGV